ncbi:MAG TPA: hypothetical protein VF525_08865 [Pyrinomonadaceae bacterium]|jgi:hypothetical protein
MDNKELKKLRRRIVKGPAREADAADAADFARWHKSTGTATLYRYPVGGEFQVVVKVYGLEYGSLYRQEIQALHSLRRTGRVCPVLADSHAHDPRYWDKDFEGPYFIAKPLYPRDLAKALNSFHWFEGLDIATQQADISAAFFECFWKDYDARLENDVIDDDGRIVRVDLDAAFPLSVFSKADKLNTVDHRYFALREREFVEAIRKERDEVPPLAEFYEVSALAIRISNMFVGRKHESDFKAVLKEMQEALPLEPQPETITAVAGPAQVADGAVAPPTGDVAAAGKWATHVAPFKRTLRSWAGKVKYIYTPRDGGGPESAGKNGEGELVPAPILPAAPAQSTAPAQTLAAATSEADVQDAVLNSWLALWIKGNPVSIELHRVFNSPDKMVYLTLSECRLLATFLYYLIAEPKHGFTLADLKASLLMLTAAFLHDRGQLIRERESQGVALLDEFSPSTHFFSLRQAAGERSRAGMARPSAAGNGAAASGALSTASAQGQLPTAPHAPALKTEIAAAAGSYWKAKNKPQSEDRAVHYFNKEEGRVAFAAVADGVSGAGGLKAAEIIESELTRRAPRLQARTPQQADSELRAIVHELNGDLMRRAKEVPRPPQAMLVMAVALVREDKCYINIAHAGDSHCIILAPDGSVVRHTANWRTKRLGEVAEPRDGDFLSEFICLNELLNFQEGTYRVRLYTDGVREEGFNRIRNTRDSTISQLVDEAGQWLGTLRSVGEDDWAVAGIDIHVKAAEVASTEPDEGAAIETTEVEQATGGLKLSDLLIAPGSDIFHLSEEAKAFWRDIVAPYSNRQEPSRFSLICAAVGAVPPQEPAQPATPRQEQAQPRQQEAAVTPVTLTTSTKPLAATTSSAAAPVATDSSLVGFTNWVETHKGDRRLVALIFSIGFICLVSIIFLTYRFIYKPSTNTNQTQITTEEGSVVQPSPTSAPKPNDLSQQIKLDLTSKGYYFHDGLNKGSEEIDETVKGLLDDMAAALDGTNLQITLYAFSPVGGESPDNRRITRIRAEKMSKYLEERHKIKVVKFVGGGLPVQANLPPQLGGHLPRQPQGASVIILR